LEADRGDVDNVWVSEMGDLRSRSQHGNGESWQHAAPHLKLRQADVQRKVCSLSLIKILHFTCQLLRAQRITWVGACLGISQSWFAAASKPFEWSWNASPSLIPSLSPSTKQLTSRPGTRHPGILRIPMENDGSDSIHSAISDGDFVLVEAPDLEAEAMKMREVEANERRKVEAQNDEAKKMREAEASKQREVEAQKDEVKKMREAEDNEKIREAEARKERDRYKYEALPSNGHFRLLRLFGREKGTIKCSLCTFEIESESLPAYRAVSYVWGDGEDQSSISIRYPDSTIRPLSVRTNVEALLTALRGSESCWLWIDGICIDQKSPKERNHQVKLMGKIYSTADRVLAWLGSYHEKIDAAFQFMLKGISYNGSETSVEAYCQSVEPVSMMYHTHRSDGLSIAWEYGWQCVAHFTADPYWTRKWIIQEILKARSVVLHSGSREIPMTEVEKFFGQLTRNPYTNDKKIPGRYHTWQKEYSHLQLGGAGSPLLVHHRFERRTGRYHPQSLHELMVRYESYKCKENSDHVYALFNLIGDHREDLVIDYTQSPAQRCLTVLYFMQKYDNLPSSKVIRITNFLLNKLGVTSEADVRNTLQYPAHDEAEPMTMTIFDRGEAQLEEESFEVLKRRKGLPALYAMSRWNLRDMKSHWEVQACLGVLPDELTREERIVSPDDLTAFRIKGADIFGLAATRVKNGDRIWQFQETALAFVVRSVTQLEEPGLDRESTARDKSQSCEIIGRAVLFSKAASNERDRLTQRTLSLPYQQHTIVLKGSDLFDLAFWADSEGSAASRFST
jgi:hypothetical protein